MGRGQARRQGPDVSAPVVIMGGAFGVMAIDDNDTVAFVGTERFVSVDYEVGEYEDFDDMALLVRPEVMR